MGYTPHILVIGGGVVGTAIARDLAIRGLEVTVLEQGTLTAGTTGRIHGLCYSGARFAADARGAKRCRTESFVLRRIADHCITDTGGYILPASGASDEFDSYVEQVEACGISFDEIPGSELAARGVEEGHEYAIQVPDATVDPFQLTVSTAAGARNFGAEIKTGAAVRDVHTDDGRVTGVTVEYDPSPTKRSPPTSTVTPVTSRTDADTGGEGTGTTDAEGPESTENNPDKAPDETGTEDIEDETEPATETDGSQSNETTEGEMPGEVQREFPGVSEDPDPELGETEEIEADYVINATGSWADHIATLAGIDLSLSKERGTMLVIDEAPDASVTRYVDEGVPVTVSPFGENGIIGPLPAGKFSSDEPDQVTAALDTATEMVPGIAGATVLRTYSGVWTQHASSSGSPYGPGATLVDHETYGDCWGMLSVIGGTVTTHRFIAQRVTDRVCSEFGIDRECLTDEIEVPDTRNTESKRAKRAELAEKAKAASATLGNSITNAAKSANPVLCETQSVRRDAVQEALDGDDVRGADLEEVRIRTGATMGSCQGGRCGHRLAGELYDGEDLDTVEASLDALLRNRWRGRRGTLWGEQLASALEDYEFHVRHLNRAAGSDQEYDLEEFDTGRSQADRDRPTCCEAVGQ